MAALIFKDKGIAIKIMAMHWLGSFDRKPHCFVLLLVQVEMKNNKQYWIPSEKEDARISWSNYFYPFLSELMNEYISAKSQLNYYYIKHINN